MKKWKVEEVEFLKQNYTQKSLKEIAKALGRTPIAVLKKAYSLGISKKRQRKWTSEEKKFLIENYSKFTVVELAEMLGRSPKSVAGMVERLGLHKTKEEIRISHIKNLIKSGIRPWTKEELEIIKRYYANMQKDKLLELLPNRTWKAINAKAHKLGLSRFRLLSRLKNENVRKMDPSEAGYLAGAIDCDGWIGITLEKYHSKQRVFPTPYIGVANTSLSILEKCKQITGIGHIRIKRDNKKSPKWRTSYYWGVESYSGIEGILKQILPYLERKWKQAILLLEYIQIWKQNILKGRYQITDRQREICKEIRELNKRGKKNL